MVFAHWLQRNMNGRSFIYYARLAVGVKLDDPHCRGVSFVVRRLSGERGGSQPTNTLDRAAGGVYGWRVNLCATAAYGVNVIKLSSHLRAVLQALLVTFLWSVSFVLIKIGLQDIPPVMFAGLRYALAAGVLLAVMLSRPAPRQAARGLTRRDWAWLVALGVVYYAITQGSQFIALDRLPSATVSMFLNFSAVVVALLGSALLRERLTTAQWIGVIVSLVGAFVYLYPVDFPAAQVIGIIAVLAGMFANSGAALMGRYVNRGGVIPPLVVTAISMGIGSALMLIVGLLTDGWPVLSLQSWVLILVLAVVNTAFAFTLWNLTLQTLPAVESTIINNTMLIQIAVLAWLFLGEALDAKAIVGLILAGVGTLIVQLKRAPEPESEAA
jgi:drug/metabolite transporter (DMT)-like permease